MFHHQLSRGSAALFFVLAATPALAAGDEPDTIIVTATRRDQPANEVPLALSVHDGAALEQHGIVSLGDLARLTPNMSSFSASPSSRYIALRGISTTAGRSTVGYTLDDISLSSFTIFQADPFLFDLDRVEVLRGPQGTLFGEGAMGGSIRLLTHQPDFESWSVKARLMGGLTRDADPSARGDVAVNIPLGSAPVALRLVGTRDVRGGYIDQPNIGKSDANDERRTEGRAALRAQPFSGTEIRLSAAAKDITYGATSLGDDAYQQHANFDTGSFDTMALYSATLTQEIGPVRLRLTQARFDREFERLTDSREDLPAALGLDIAPLDTILLAAVDAVEITDAGDSLYDTTEVQANAAWGPLHAVAGFYFADKQDVQLAHWLIDLNPAGLDAALSVLEPLIPGLAGQADIPLLDQTYRTDQRQYAAYGQIDWAITNALSLAVGTRYTVETITVETTGTSSFLPTDGLYEDELKVWTPRAHLALDLSELFKTKRVLDHATLYLSAARGFRSGGANAALSGPLGGDVDPVYGPDFLWTYEIGLKSSLWGGRLVPEIAVYYNQWRDVQAWVAGNLFPYIKNVGDAAGFGVDASLGVEPIKGIRLTATAGVNRVEFTTDTSDKAAGDPTDNAPRFTASLSLDARQPLFGRMAGYLLADLSYEGESFYTYRSAGIAQTGPAHTLINARFGVEHPHGRFGLYADNLTDYRGLIDANAPPGEQASRLRPRTIGLELTLTMN